MAGRLSRDLAWPVDAVIRPCRDAVSCQRTCATPATGSYPQRVAEVSADDNSIQRFIVQHYRYAPERHEPRNVIVAAFDNEAEFKYRIHELSAEVERRRSPANRLTQRACFRSRA